MKQLFLLPLLLITFSGISQSTPNTIMYQFSHAIDSTISNSIINEEMMVTFNKDGSKYFSYTGVVQKEKTRKKLEEADRTGSTNVNLGIIRKTTEDEYYLFPAYRKMFTIKQYKSIDYQIAYLLPDLKWQIKQQTKDIQGYNCQLATGYWRGRTYDAWFTTDIPFPVGPWKLNGLPGAILEAADKTGTIKFDCIQISFTPNLKIELPEGGILTSDKEYDKMREGMRNTSSKLRSETPTVIVTETTLQADKNSRSGWEYNNPIELTKQ